MASTAGSRTAVAPEAVLVEAASVLIIEPPKIRTDITAFDRREALMSGQLVPALGAPIPFVIELSTQPSPLARVKMPSAANTTAAVMRIVLTGSISAILSPASTAGILASIMPRVVPMTTA
jgi:hypothetical protein